MQELWAVSEALDWLQPKVQSIGDFVFFRQIMGYLQHEIREFGIGLLGRSMQWVSGIALTLLTLWIMIQGLRILTGQSRDSMMALVVSSLRSMLILSAATAMAAFGTDLHEFLNGDLKKEINWLVSGDLASPEKRIDDSLAWMQVALSSIDALDVLDDPGLDGQKNRAMWFAGIGAGGPAITGGTLLLLYEIALAMFIGLGPIFILCLLFDQTKSLFQRWLLYGIGTLFSMAMLSAMVSIALEMVTRVSAAFWGASLVGSLLGANLGSGMTSQAMQQGAMGLILTLLIVSVPPMAASFFQGTLGNFMHFSAFGSGSQTQPGMPTPMHTSAPQAANNDRAGMGGSYGSYGSYGSGSGYAQAAAPRVQPSSAPPPTPADLGRVTGADTGTGWSPGRRGLGGLPPP